MGPYEALSLPRSRTLRMDIHRLEALYTLGKALNTCYFPSGGWAVASDWDASCVSLLPGPWCEEYVPPGLWFGPKAERASPSFWRPRGEAQTELMTPPDLGIAQDPRFPYWPGIWNDGKEVRGKKRAGEKRGQTHGSRELRVRGQLTGRWHRCPSKFCSSRLRAPGSARARLRINPHLLESFH